MSDQTPCSICKSLGFVCHDESQLSPIFNVFGLLRKRHSDGRVTWEGECMMCRGTGFDPKPRQEYEARLSPFRRASGDHL